MGVRLMLFSFDKCAAMLTCILCIQGGSKPRFSTAQEEPKKLSDILRQVSDGNFYTNTCVQLALTRRTHRCDAHSNHQRHAAVFEHACVRSHPPLARICSILPCPPCPATNSPQHPQQSSHCSLGFCGIGFLRQTRTEQAPSPTSTH
jgi:hypothetical protein